MSTELERAISTHKIVRDSRGWFCKVPHCWSGEYALSAGMAKHEHERFLNPEPHVVEPTPEKERDAR